MKTLNDIVEELVKNTSYPREVVEFHVERISRKFKYELAGKKQNLLSKEDAADVASIASRFFHDRKGHEERKDNATQLLAIVPVAAVKDSDTSTKPLPIIKIAKRKPLFGRNNPWFNA